MKSRAYFIQSAIQTIFLFLVIGFSNELRDALAAALYNHLPLHISGWESNEAMQTSYHCAISLAFFCAYLLIFIFLLIKIIPKNFKPKRNQKTSLLRTFIIPLTFLILAVGITVLYELIPRIISMQKGDVLFKNFDNVFFNCNLVLLALLIIYGLRFRANNK